MTCSTEVLVCSGTLLVPDDTRTVGATLFSETDVSAQQPSSTRRAATGTRTASSPYGLLGVPAAAAMPVGTLLLAPPSGPVACLRLRADRLTAEYFAGSQNVVSRPSGTIRIFAGSTPTGQQTVDRFCLPKKQHELRQHELAMSTARLGSTAEARSVQDHAIIPSAALQSLCTCCWTHRCTSTASAAGCAQWSGQTHAGNLAACRLPALAKVSLLNCVGTHTSSMALTCSARWAGRLAVSNMVRAIVNAVCRGSTAPSVPGTSTLHRGAQHGLARLPASGACQPQGCCRTSGVCTVDGIDHAAAGAPSAIP